MAPYARDVLAGRSGIETPWHTLYDDNNTTTNTLSATTFLNNIYYVTGAQGDETGASNPTSSQGKLSNKTSYVSGAKGVTGRAGGGGYVDNILIVGMANEVDSSLSGIGGGAYPYLSMIIEGYGNKFINPSPYYDYTLLVNGYNNEVGSATSNYNYGYGSLIMGTANKAYSLYGAYVIGESNILFETKTNGSAGAVGPQMYIFGKGNKMIAETTQSFIMGVSNNNTGATSGPLDNSAWIGKSNTGSGSYSYQIGASNYCSGSYTFSFGNNNDNRGNGFNGTYIVGNNNVNTATRAYIMGDYNTISTTDTGSINVMLGAYNTATHGAGVMLGRKNSNTSVNSRDSVAIGQYVALRNKNTISMGGGSDVAAVGTGLVGNYQETTAFYMCKTANATPVEAFLGGGVLADAATARNSIPTDCTATFSYTVTARRTDADGSSAGWHGKGVIRNDGGTTALVGSVTLTEIGKEGFGVPVAPVFTAANDALTLTLTGDTTTIGWHAVVKMNMVVG